MSPAMCLFGRPIKDFVPIYLGKYLPHSTWQSVLADRENALQQCHMKIAERLEQHTKRLPALRVNDRVRLQNQIGLNPKRWDKTGSVIEVKQHDQYIIRVDGSRHVTLRNRKFLQKYIPVHQTPSFTDNTLPVPTPSLRQARITPANKHSKTQVAPIPLPSLKLPEETHSELIHQPITPPVLVTFTPSSTATQDPSLRRSKRIRMPPPHLKDYGT